MMWAGTVRAHQVRFQGQKEIYFNQSPLLDRERGRDGLREWGDRKKAKLKDEEEKKEFKTRRKQREREIMMKQFVVTCISSVEQLCDVCAEDSFLLCTVAVILGYEIMAFVLKMGWWQRTKIHIQRQRFMTSRSTQSGSTLTSQDVCRQTSSRSTGQIQHST